ncbi:N,N-dimethylformamidase beta subunit family domain-containing protein [Agrobacterium sp. P15N1-A]|uniref:N,N-dimethylformamidase beta subunit family domain-containing protein n=1 Tax=Agrobacterium sp. P15N1-A TaxID=3342820 RepID=UPI0037DD7648
MRIHVHTTAQKYNIEIVRDGASPLRVWSRVGQAGEAHETPVDAYERGCGWPVSVSFDIDENCLSGFYLIVVSMEMGGRTYEREGFFVVRGQDRPHRPSHVLVLTTSTMTAYNDWGGANHYRGLGNDPYTDIASPRLSTQRPVARGMLRQPIGAPRASFPGVLELGALPRHPSYEWAHVHGYSRHAADAFWATYERPFVVWAESQGYALEYLTQHDLHEDPGCLDSYACVTFVGHDEYWTWEMRDTVERYVKNGGNVARFGGNFIWQVRLEEGGTRQVCYKLPELDPLYEINPSRTTTAWDAPCVSRPGAWTMGLTGTAGCYNRYGTAAPRSSGGYTVYRPRHWVFDNTDLNYGDVFGAAPVCVAGFELDGVDYTFRHGLPYPTFEDGAPETLEILAMTPAVVGEIDKWNGAVPLGAPESEVKSFLQTVFADQLPERFRGECYGSGMVATFMQGKGNVFNAGSTEWVNGLIHADPFTEQITHNVLRRFGGGNSPDS